MWVLRARKGLRALQGTLVHKGLKVSWVLWVRKGLKVRQGTRVHKALKVS